MTGKPSGAGELGNKTLQGGVSLAWEEVAGEQAQYSLLLSPSAGKLRGLKE